MRRLTQFFGTLFGMAVLGCAALAGWALWTGGLFDGAVAKDLRGSSVHVAPGIDIDEAAAERIIGNRRLTVAFLEPGTDLRDVCDGTEGATRGTVLLPLSPGEEDYDSYPCTRTTEDIGEGVVIETIIGRGIDQFLDRPLEALKLVAVNYDQLVKAELVPDGARTVTPSLPRYLIAAAAIGAVLVGATIIYLAARRAGRLAAARKERRDSAHDARSALGAAAAVLAQQIIELDGVYARLRRRVNAGTATEDQRSFVTRYRSLVTDYTELLGELSTMDEGRARHLRGRVENLTDKGRRLARLAERATAR
ncbi:hypothetical protein [Prauserella cavernicola]|uniref:Uncharacterized protein n=1 Tax=Prauserella cavernicola TaxID=2800127 RepID=A0A934QNQ5_9PSEU|nr:hypothetical protein [Prauserella cavernicola]MBK1783585.1 hypothetical protein [Prauserella cavernicola]